MSNGEKSLMSAIKTIYAFCFFIGSEPSPLVIVWVISNQGPFPDQTLKALVMQAKGLGLRQPNWNFGIGFLNLVGGNMDTSCTIILHNSINS